jgi:hypothetical protein
MKNQFMSNNSLLPLTTDKLKKEILLLFRYLLKESNINFYAILSK